LQNWPINGLNTQHEVVKHGIWHAEMFKRHTVPNIDLFPLTKIKGRSSSFTQTADDTIERKFKVLGFNNRKYSNKQTLLEFGEKEDEDQLPKLEFIGITN